MSARPRGAGRCLALGTMKKDSNIKTNIKRAGQGIIIFVALFLFVSPALAYTGNFADNLGAGDTFQTVDYGNYSFDNYDDWLAFTNVSLEPGLPPDIYTTYGGAYVDDEAIGFAPFLSTSTPFVLDIPPEYNIVLERSAYPNGLDINFCSSNLVDCYFVKHLDWLPLAQQPEACAATDATSSLDCLAGPAIHASTFFATNFINHFWPFILVFGILAALTGATFSWVSSIGRKSKSKR